MKIYLLKFFFIIIFAISVHPQLKINQDSLVQTISFTKSSQTFPPSVTFEVILGDVDNDGDLDAVFSNMEFNNCQIWLNDDSGFFTNSGQNLTEQAHGVALGDLDGDGDLDLFVTCAHFYSSRWFYKPSKIYFNDGNGVFQDSGQNLNDTNISGNLVDLIDVDNDNDLDAYIVYYPPPSKLYINDGLGNFTNSGQDFPFCVNWGDLDADGDIDYFVKDLGIGYRVMLNDGVGNFSEGWSMSDVNATMDYHSSVLDDFDNDGDIDVLINNGTLAIAKPFKVLFNDGSGNFNDSSSEYGLMNLTWIRTGDFDNDGNTDAFFSIVENPNQIWLNNGNANFQDSGLRMGDNTRTRGSYLGDLDDDGDQDIFVGIYEQVSNEVWFNNAITSVDNESLTGITPNSLQLLQNFPNPFNPSTKIKYSLSTDGFVSLKVYDVLGNEIVTLVNEYKLVGSYEIEFNVEKHRDAFLPSGVYFYQSKIGDYIQTKKMLYLK